MIFKTTNGESSDRKTLLQVFEALNDEDFAFAERRYIVNLRKIVKIEESNLYLENGEVLNIGAKYREVLRVHLRSCWNGEE